MSNMMMPANWKEPAPVESPTIWQPGINRDEVHREYVASSIKMLTEQVEAMRTELRAAQDLLRSLATATYNNALSARQQMEEMIGRESAAEFDRQFRARLPELIEQAKDAVAAVAEESATRNPDNRKIDPTL